MYKEKVVSVEETRTSKENKEITEEDLKKLKEHFDKQCGR